MAAAKARYAEYRGEDLRVGCPAARVASQDGSNGPRFAVEAQQFLHSIVVGDIGRPAVGSGYSRIKSRVCIRKILAGRHLAKPLTTTYV